MIIDILVSSLLMVTILFCWRLSKKVAGLNSSRKELQSIIVEFDRAIVRAQSSISSLKALTQETDEQLQKHIEKARFLTNDLAFLTHKGDSVADKLEAVVSSGKFNYLNAFGGAKTPPRPQISAGNPANAREALHASLGWQKTDKNHITAAKPPNQEMPLSKKQALEEVLEQIAARKKKSEPTAAPKEAAESLEQ